MGDKAVENPTYAELRDVCAAAGLTVGVENKVHPREPDSRDARFRGRIRVQLRDDDGTPLHEQFPNRQAILKYLGEMIPKLKSRQPVNRLLLAEENKRRIRKRTNDYFCWLFT